MDVWVDPDEVLELLAAFPGWTVPGARAFWREQRRRDVHRVLCVEIVAQSDGPDDTPEDRQAHAGHRRKETR